MFLFYKKNFLFFRTSEYTRILRKKALKQDEILGPGKYVE